MPFDSGSEYENPEKFKHRVSDPMADHKRKARQRLIGSVFFSFFVLAGSIVLFRDKPRSLVEDIVIENSFETKTFKNKKAIDTEFVEEMNLSIRDKRIIEISNSLVWMVRVGIFNNKTNAENLKNRLIEEGRPVVIVPQKVGNVFIYYVKVGPFKQPAAEKFRRQALSRGLNADLDRL